MISLFPAPCHFTVARRPWLTLTSGLLLPSQGRLYLCPIYNPFSGSATHQPLLLVPPTEEGAGGYGGGQAITLGMGEHSDGLQVTWDPSLEEPKFIRVYQGWSLSEA